MYKTFLALFLQKAGPGARLFYGVLLERFTVHRLAKSSWVSFADLRLRSLAMKYYEEYTKGG